MGVFSGNGLPNMGGPGWVGNVFEVSLNVDEKYPKYPVTGAMKNYEIKSLDINSSLSGKVLIAAPDGREVSHEGVEIYFKTFVCCRMDFANAREYVVMDKKWPLLDKGPVSGAIEVPFDIDLSKIAELRESYVSPVFELRHVLGYTIRRPWWTFAVTGEEEIDVRQHTALPSGSGTGEPMSTLLSVDDFGGKATFDHGDYCYFNDGVIKGTLNLSEMTSANISEITLVLRRNDVSGEFADNFESRKLTIHPTSEAPLTADRSFPVEFKIGEKGEENAEDNPGNDDFLVPSMKRMFPSDEGTDPEQFFEVSYFLRLTLYGAEGSAVPVTRGDPTRKESWSMHKVTLLKKIADAGKAVA